MLSGWTFLRTSAPISALVAFLMRANVDLGGQALETAPARLGRRGRESPVDYDVGAVGENLQVNCLEPPGRVGKHRSKCLRVGDRDALFVQLGHPDDHCGDLV